MHQDIGWRSYNSVLQTQYCPEQQTTSNITRLKSESYTYDQGVTKPRYSRNLGDVMDVMVSHFYSVVPSLSYYIIKLLGLNLDAWFRVSQLILSYSLLLILSCKYGMNRNSPHPPIVQCKSLECSSEGTSRNCWQKL